MMTSNKAKSLITQNWAFYLVGLIVIFGFKYLYSKAGSDELDWILAPTALWVRTLSGIAFEKETHIGYVNHHIRFIIAPSCSGVQFMLITFATLHCSFVHRMGTKIRKFCWLTLSLGFSYLFTVFVNGFRIAFSIYLPTFLQNSGTDLGWITPEKLHTLEGALVYFVSLFIIYHIAGYLSQRIASVSFNFKYVGGPSIQAFCKCLPPMFWYFAFTLGIPLLNKAYTNNFTKFIEYAILMIVVCFVTVFLFCLTSILRERFGCRRKLRHELKRR